MKFDCFGVKISNKIKNRPLKTLIQNLKSGPENPKIASENRVPNPKIELSKP